MYLDIAVTSYPLTGEPRCHDPPPTIQISKRRARR